MTACERGNWIDTEGYIRPKHHLIEVTSKEKEPLIDYCEGAKTDNVPCKIRSVKDPVYGIAYRAEIIGADNVAKEITLTKNCIRTKMRHAQIQAFIEDIARPRKRLRKEIITARQIMGIPSFQPEVALWKPRRKRKK